MPLIQLPPDELTALTGRIRNGWTLAKSAHGTRIEKAKEAYRRFRNRVDAPRAGDEAASNVRVPLIQWQVLSELSREAVALFGDDSEIMAKPVGPADERLVRKIARYMDWRVFDSMKAVNPFLEFIFRKIVYGRAFALAPWKRDVYTVLGDDGKKQDALWYDGPEFLPLWPDEVIVPPESVRNVQEFSWTVCRSRLTWDDLLRGEHDGKYFDVSKNIDRIKGWASGAGERSAMGDEVRAESDEAEGVTYRNAFATRGSLEVWTWYGYSEPSTTNGSREEWVVTYLPDLFLVIGVQDLAEIYPQSRWRRPIVESGLIPNGDYWCMGFAEALEVWEDELSANENLFTDAQQFSVGPLIIAKPALGAQLRRTKYEPFSVLDSEEPSSAQVVRATVDATGYQIKQQSTLAIAERIFGISDSAMGRAIDRPNAPRTAAGQSMLLQQGDIRMSLNMIALREDMAKILGHIWELECQFATDGGQFFRVTEEDAGGFFSVQNGGALMDRRDFAGRYDFDIKFATSNWDRASRKADASQLFQAAMLNPIIVQNPRALWAVTNELYKAFGNDHFGDIVPEPPDPGLPKQPREEWTLMLQGEGEDVHVNPLDDDQQHILDHSKRMDQQAEAMAMGEPVNRQAIQQMLSHIVDHKQQMKQKMALQAMTQQIAQSLQQVGQGAMSPELGGGANMALQSLFGGQPGIPGQAPQPGQPQPQEPPGAGQPSQGPAPPAGLPGMTQ